MLNFNKRKTMKSKELVFDELIDGAGITAISLVETPAIMINWMAFNKDNPQPYQFKAIDEDKQMIAGPVMIPGMDIPRIDPVTKEKFTVFYTPETVAKLNEHFIKSGKQASATLEHSMTLNGVSVIETWIVEDSEKDKSAHYGFNLPVGTWFVVMKVDDKRIWKGVKDGLIKGFSVEGQFGHVEKHSADQKQNIILSTLNMLKNKIAELSKEVFASQQEETKSDNVKMGSVSVSDTNGTAVELIFTGDVIEVGTEVRIMNEANEEVSAENGTYTDAEGGSIVVVGGLVTEINTAEASSEEDTAETESTTEEMSAEKVKALISESLKGVEANISNLLTKFGAMIDEENLKTEKSIKAVNEKMSTIASVEAISDVPDETETLTSESFSSAAKEYKKNKNKKFKI